MEAELIGLEMLDIILILDQANAIRLRSNLSLIKIRFNINDSITFLITLKAKLDETLIQTTLQERF